MNSGVIGALKWEVDLFVNYRVDSAILRIIIHLARKRHCNWIKSNGVKYLSVIIFKIDLDIYFNYSLLSGYFVYLLRRKISRYFTREGSWVTTGIHENKGWLIIVPLRNVPLREVRRDNRKVAWTRVSSCQKKKLKKKILHARDANCVFKNKTSVYTKVKRIALGW